jgi:hypothetical protein
MQTTDSTNSASKVSAATRSRVLVAAGIVAIASVTGATVSAQIYGLKGLNGQLAPVTSADWLPIGLNATFAHAMLYRNSHLRTIAQHVAEKGTSAVLVQYAQAQLPKLDDWDARITALLKANNITTDFADNELNKSYEAVEELAATLSTLEGAALDKKFKAQMIILSRQVGTRLQGDISLLDDKELEGVAAEISGANNTVAQEINAG